MKKKNIIILIIVLLIAVIGVLLAIFVPSILKNSEINKGTNNSGNQIDKLDYDLDKANELLDYYGFNIRFGCTTIAQYSYNDTFKALVALEKVDSSYFKEEECSNLFSEEKLEKANTPDQRYRGETGVCFSNNTKSTTNIVSYSDVNKVYKKLYGEDMPKKSINSLKISNQYYIFYDYLAEKDAFVQMNCSGCGGSCYSQHIRKIKDATIEGNTLTINFYDYETGYYELNDNKFNLVTSNIDTTFECDSQDACIQKVENDYLDKLDLFEAVFEKNGDSFIFKSFTKKLS